MEQKLHNAASKLPTPKLTAGDIQKSAPAKSTRLFWRKLVAAAACFALLMGAGFSAYTYYAGASTTAPKPFAGKTLQIQGVGDGRHYTDYSSFHWGNYMWMMRAAIDEWATINDVTVEYVNYGAYQTGAQEKPADVIFALNSANLCIHDGGFLSLTAQEYSTLADIMGDGRYLDMLTFNGQSYGAVLPWTGSYMLYFNQSVFAYYKVKSPMDYWAEGAWTWENMEKCINEITRDLNGDGVCDIYGLSGNSWEKLANPVKWENGEAVSILDEPWLRELFQMKYSAYTGGTTTDGIAGDIHSNGAYPLAAMEIGSCEQYRFDSVYRTSPNGDVLVAVPLPRWEGENGQTRQWQQWSRYAVYMGRGCDEREAAFDLLCYVMRCGMKYMSDCSMGAISYEGKGIRGLSRLSKQFKSAFAANLEVRHKNVKRLKFDCVSHMRKLAEHMAGVEEWYTCGAYDCGTTAACNPPNALAWPESAQLPADSALAAIREKYETALKDFNALFGPSLASCR